MAVRDYAELSTILKDIATRLLADQTLCKLLYYKDSDPLGHANITDTKMLLNSRIKFMPKVGPQDESDSTIVVVFYGGDENDENREILDLVIQIFVYTPFASWIIKGDELRIFLIMSRIKKVLNDKIITGIGKLRSNGFKIDLTTDELSGYKMEFFQDVFS